MRDMTDKVALITGASRGIGAETARAFVAAGAQVVLLARSDDAIAGLARDLGEDRALALPCDVADFGAMADAVQTATDGFGKIDVLVNNAGVIEPVSHLATADPKAWARAIDINLTGVFNGMRAALPGMIERGSGTILTVSSGAAHRAIEGWSHYCASKAGAAMLTEAADLENRDHGLRIMGLSPGTVATQMQREIKASDVNPVSKLDWSDHIPPEWVAQALLWMCTGDADDWIGREVSLRDPAIRARIGLTD
ncbi:SDR family oxidoreductase [Oceaniglobus indicus]|uniref:SDR family oxidoreductase n=1 Tax=Oceaniglobus indicus TaxID=2047749 RepID=UPI000C18A7FA|nr:SDR family oxidoreductase [Oceaniglobus indicus]